jgi:digeranylgeranylglycerophospholipid reductase
MKDAQIVVIGAGPAGSTAAEAAASAGADVILADKKREIGSPVQCGGFIPTARELSSMIPQATLPSTLIDIPDRYVLHRTSLQRLFSPGGKSAEFPVQGRCIDRRSFDRHLAIRAARAGARIFPATVASIVGESVRMAGRVRCQVKALVVIGADGPGSGVAKSLRSSPNANADVHLDEPGICLEYEMADVNIDEKAAEMYFGLRWAPGGYAWIIPLGNDVANVGVGVRRSYIKDGAKLPDILDRFIREHPIAREKLARGSAVAVMSGIVPSGGMPNKIRRGNVLLAGDAAGQVMATSGGGIPLAMVAGRIAGVVAAGHVMGEAELSAYEKEVETAFGRVLSSSVRIRRLIDLSMNSDRSMDLIFSALEPGMMLDVMRGRMPGALGRLLNSIISQ